VPVLTKVGPIRKARQFRSVTTEIPPRYRSETSPGEKFAVSYQVLPAQPMIRTFIPPAQGLVHRVRVLWKEELAAVAQTDAAGQTKERCRLQLCPEACIKITIRILTKAGYGRRSPRQWRRMLRHAK